MRRQKYKKLMLCSINSALLEVFRVTRLDQVFYIYKNREIIVDGPPTQAQTPCYAALYTRCGGWVRFEGNVFGPALSQRI